MSQVKPQVSQRMAMLRFLMIFGVVVLHVPPYVSLAEVPFTLFDSTKSFFQHAVFRVTVPVLTFISGYLLFSTSLADQPLRLYKKKVRSLGIPFLCFNLGVLLAVWFAQRLLDVQLASDLVAGGWRPWFDAAFGYSNAPVNYPLAFLRDMMVLVLLAPLFAIMLRLFPFIGLALVYAVFMPDVDGLLVLRGAMPVLFYLGGLAAVRQVDMLALDRLAWPCLLVFLLACAVFVALRARNTSYLALASPFLVWPAASLLDGTRLGRLLLRLSRYSFFLFLAHAPLLTALWLVYQKAGTALPYQAFWFAAPFAVTAMLVAVHRSLDAFAPRLLAFATGAKPETRAPRPVFANAVRPVE